MTEKDYLQQIVGPLICWYQKHARKLPWREDLNSKPAEWQNRFELQNDPSLERSRETDNGVLDRPEKSGRPQEAGDSEKPVVSAEHRFLEDQEQQVPEAELTVRRNTRESDTSFQGIPVGLSQRTKLQSTPEKGQPGAITKEQADLSYRVWISEIMLQQTRVEAVKPYFQRFLEALPGMKELSECPEEKLLKLWEGLGYYNRARNLQKTARLVMENYGGVLPADYEKLLKLPGIGSYTAGAIASICYGIPVAAVDGNVLRVVSRILERTEDVTKQAVKKSMEGLLGEIIPKDCPGTFNQALMELGALVCVPNKEPLCDSCPLERFCLAKLHERQQELPVRPDRKKRRIEQKTVFVLRDGVFTVLRRRPSRGLLADLYEFPNLEGHLTQEQAVSFLKKEGFSPLRIQLLPPAKHIFTHVEWQMTGYLVLVEDLTKFQTEGLPKEAETPKVVGEEPANGSISHGKKDRVGEQRKRPAPDEKVNGTDSRYQEEEDDFSPGGTQEDLSFNPKKSSFSFLIVEPERTKEEYPIPTAFAAYAKYLEIRLGQEKVGEEGRQTGKQFAPF